MSGRQHDEVLDALGGVVDCLEETVRQCTEALEQAATVRAGRLAGRSYQQVLSEGERPLIVERMSATLAGLQRTGHQLRSAEARALYDEGLTMRRIADLFGVTHQRISALIRAESGPSAGQGSTPAGGAGMPAASRASR